MSFSLFKNCYKILIYKSYTFSIYIYIYIYSIYITIIIIIIMSCRRHGHPWPSLATSPYRSSPLAGLQGYIPYPHIAVACSSWLSCFCPAICGVHRSTSLMNSSLLLQQCPACLVRLTWIVFVIGGRWPYSWCLVGLCRQDLFNIARIYIYIYIYLSVYMFKHGLAVKSYKVDMP